MTFGAACSPSAAHHVKTVNAKRFMDSDPRAVKAIVDYLYVDDYVDSFATKSEAIGVATRVKELCKVSSSSPAVERMLGPSEHAQSIGWGEAEQKILEMRWQPATDDFRFRVQWHPSYGYVKVRSLGISLLPDGKRETIISRSLEKEDPMGRSTRCIMPLWIGVRRWRKWISSGAHVTILDMGK